MQVELDGLKKDLDKVSVKTQDILKSPQQSASAPVLRSELELTVQKMDHANMLSSVYLEKLVPADQCRFNKYLCWASILIYSLMFQAENCGNGHP